MIKVCCKLCSYFTSDHFYIQMYGGNFEYVLLDQSFSYKNVCETLQECNLGILVHSY